MEVLFRRLALIFLLLLSCISAKAAFKDNQVTTNSFTNGLSGQVLTSLGPTGNLRWATPSGGDSTNVWTTNASYIFPRFPTNAIHINRTKGGIIIGTNGIGSVPDSEVFRAVFDSTMGDPSAATWTLEANVTGSGTYGGSLLNVNTAGDAYFALYNHKGAGFGLEFNPNAVAGVTPFALNSSVNQTSGMLLSVSNLDVGKWNVAHNGVTWSATNRFAFGTITNVWPLTNGLAGQLLTSSGGAGAQMYWSSVSASGPTFADLVWTNNAGRIQPISTNQTFILPNGAIMVGTNSLPGVWLSEEAGRILLGQSLTSRGGPNNQSLVLGVADEADRDTYLELKTTTNDVRLKMSYEPWGTVTLIQPLVLPNDVPYYFDSIFVAVGQPILDVLNRQNSMFRVLSTNGIATPAITAYGAVSKAWQFGAGSNNVDVLLRATNMAEVTIEGVGAVLIPYARK